jgi:RimJ/RimL family protein N-acetyltransferase
MVNYNNERAIRLYEKFGFEREVVKRHALKVNGHYIDAFYMAKLIGG